MEVRHNRRHARRGGARRCGSGYRCSSRYAYPGHLRYRDAKRYRSGPRYSRRYYDYDYPRYSRRYHDYPRYSYGRRYRSNNGAAVAAGIFGLAAGAIIGSQLSGPSSHHAACARKYRSYDPYSGTYLGYDGYRHACRLY